MKGKVIDINKTDAFIALNSGETIDMAVSHLPKHIKVGDIIDVPFSATNSTVSLTNDKLIDFF